MNASVVVAVALEENGTNVHTHSQEPWQVEIDGTGGGKCPVMVVLQSTNAVPYAYTDSCGTGEFKHGAMRIVYSPPSIGPTVRRAVANLG